MTQLEYEAYLNGQDVYGSDTLATAYQDQTGIFDDIADLAGQGFGGLGQASEFLMRAGYTVEAIRNAFGNISNVVGAPSQQVDLARQELAYLNNNNGRYQNPNMGMWLGIAAVGLLVLLSRRD